MSKAVENNEAGTKRYQFYLNEDETQCVINESYANLQALLSHLKGVAFLTIFPRIFNICKIDKVAVFVDMNEWKLVKALLMKALTQMGGANYHFLTGFSLSCASIIEQISNIFILGFRPTLSIVSQIS
jgi:hypothetical protein